MSVVILLMYFSLLIYLNKKKKNKVWCASNLVIGLYGFSTLMSIVLVLVYGHEAPSIKSVLVFILMLTPYFIPLFFFPDSKGRMDLEVPNNISLKSTTILFSVLGVFCLLYYSRFINDIFSFGDFSVGRNYTTGLGNNLNQNAGQWISRLATVGANLYLVFISLAAFNLILKRKINFSTVLMLILSTGIFVVSLIHFGRAGIVVWGGGVLVAFLLVKDHISSRINKKFILVGLLFSSVMLVWSFRVTQDRFSRSSGGVVYSLISYSGQQIFNFERALNISSGFNLQWGMSNFPLFVSGFNVNEARNTDYYSAKDIGVDYERQGMYGNVFGTFLKSFMGDFGILGTFIFGVFIGITLTCYFVWANKRNVINISCILVTVWYGSFLINGLFYHIWGNTSQNVIYIYIPMLALFYNYGKPQVLPSSYKIFNRPRV
jgi:oligosaccharide repeat unit polymerase